MRILVVPVALPRSSALQQMLVPLALSLTASSALQEDEGVHVLPVVQGLTHGLLAPMTYGMGRHSQAQTRRRLTARSSLCRASWMLWVCVMSRRGQCRLTLNLDDRQ